MKNFSFKWLIIGIFFNSYGMEKEATLNPSFNSWENKKVIAIELTDEKFVDLPVPVVKLCQPLVDVLNDCCDSEKDNNPYLPFDQADVEVFIQLFESNPLNSRLFEKNHSKKTVTAFKDLIKGKSYQNWCSLALVSNYLKVNNIAQAVAQLVKEKFIDFYANPTHSEKDLENFIEELRKVSPDVWYALTLLLTEKPLMQEIFCKGIFNFPSLQTPIAGWRIGKRAVLDNGDIVIVHHSKASLVSESNKKRYWENGSKEIWEWKQCAPHNVANWSFDNKKILINDENNIYACLVDNPVQPSTLNPLYRHTAIIKKVGLAKSGKMLLIKDVLNQYTVLNVETGEPLISFKPLLNEKIRVPVKLGEDWLVFIHNGYSIKIKSREDAEFRKAFYSTNKRKLSFVGLKKGEIKTIDINEEINTIKINAAGTLAAMEAKDGRIRLFNQKSINLESLVAINFVPQIKQPSIITHRNLLFVTDKFLAVKDKTSIYVYETQQGAHYTTLEIGVKPIGRAFLSPNNKLLFGWQRGEKKVFAFELSSGQHVATFEHESKWISNVRLSPSGNYLVTAGTGRAKRWPLSAPSFVKNLICSLAIEQKALLQAAIECSRKNEQFDLTSRPALAMMWNDLPGSLKRGFEEFFKTLNDPSLGEK